MISNYFGSPGATRYSITIITILFVWLKIVSDFTLFPLLLREEMGREEMGCQAFQTLPFLRVLRSGLSGEPRLPKRWSREVPC